MFGLGGAELAVVILLALIIIGPKDIPRVAHQLGRIFSQLKGATEEFKNTVNREVALSEKDPPPDRPTHD